ncbi:RNA polymerase ECF-type sigma factor [Arcticibacter svalbardensis MN12-7]|uniref:RNA polymerase ECF-type sigma factor n=1 Tax=Arcticibacter svalbardensis MN12-7 TaxID=1150600 RepID=R9GRS6_9SPHI|nr:RNA polymerase ECF-type sigma factor [Arcticibacter svalbardensis MN12-7]
MDKDLIISLKKGSPLAMEAIYQHHWESVFDRAFKKTGNEHVAQDITQEIFISLWKKRNEINLESNLGAYLQGAVKYQVINYFKSQSVTDVHRAEFALLINKELSVSADSDIILKDLNIQFDAAIALLPEKMQLIVSMSRKQEKSLKEIASELNVSIQTVKNQITAAMKVIRKNIPTSLF